MGCWSDGVMEKIQSASTLVLQLQNFSTPLLHHSMVAEVGRSDLETTFANSKIAALDNGR